MNPADYAADGDRELSSGPSVASDCLLAA